MPTQRSVLREGTIAGLLGAATVAVWFLIFDALRGKLFLTPTLLGAAVFYGVKDPTGLDPALGPILGYALVHGLAFRALRVAGPALDHLRALRDAGLHRLLTTVAALH